MQFGLGVVAWVENESKNQVSSLIAVADSEVADVMARGGQPTKSDRRDLEATVGQLLRTKDIGRDVALRAAAVIQWEFDIGAADDTVRDLSPHAKGALSRALNRLWRALYGDKPFLPGDVLAADARLDRMSARHLAMLARIHLLEQTNQDEAAARARREMATLGRRSSHRSGLVFGTYAVLGGFGVAVIVMYGLRRRVSPAPGCPRSWDPATADALAEGYVFQTVLSLAAINLVGWLLLSLTKGAISEAATIYAGIPVELLAFWLALKYLWRLGWRYGFAPEELGWRRPDWLRDILWGIGGWCAAIATAGVVGIVAELVFQGIPEAPHPIGQAVEQAGAWEMVCIFLVACVVAPVVEETFFRGVLFMGLWRRLRSFWTAAVLAGAAFAMLHPTLFAGLFPLACVGVVGCVLMRERRSLAACMVMHCLFNTTTLVFGLMTR